MAHVQAQTLVLCIGGPILILFLVLRFIICYPRATRIPFANRHVFITGGSSGIGLELAKLAIAEGSSVSIMARDLSRLTQAKLSIASSTGKEVKIYCGDVKDFESVRAVADQASPIDILICSHGISIPKSFEDSSLDEINHVLDTNLRGNLHVIKAVLPSMKNRKDHQCASIAIMSSQAGQAKDPHRQLRVCRQRTLIRQPPGLLQPIQFSQPFELVAWDVIDPLPISAKGNRFIIIFT